MQTSELKLAREHSREIQHSRRANCPPDLLPIEWMRFAEADACIAEWCRELSEATFTDITLDDDARARLQNMAYKNRHAYLRRLTEAIIARNVRCPSAYLIVLLKGDDYRSDWPWEIYRRPWAMPEGHYVKAHYI